MRAGSADSLLFMIIAKINECGGVMAIINALTINVEDYFQAPAFKRSIKVNDWGLLSSRLELSINKTLQLLSDHGVTATFFVYAWTIKTFPNLITRIAAQGHEIAYRHHSVLPTVMSADTVMELQNGRDKLAQLIGCKVSGFRTDATMFSFDNENLYDELMFAGFEYSSSVNLPTAVPEQWLPQPLSMQPRPGFLELPLSTHIAFTRRYEIINPHFLKLRRYEVSKHLVDQHLDETKMPLIASVSNWMLDDEQPKIRADSFMQRWLHHYRLKDAPLLLHQILAEYRWGRMEDIYLHKVLPLHKAKSQNSCII